MQIRKPSRLVFQIDEQDVSALRFLLHDDSIAYTIVEDIAKVIMDALTFSIRNSVEFN